MTSQRRLSRLGSKEAITREKMEVEKERFAVRVALATLPTLRDNLTEEFEKDRCVVIARVHCQNEESLKKAAEIFRARAALVPLFKATGGEVIKTSTSRFFVVYKQAAAAVAGVIICQEGLHRYNTGPGKRKQLFVSFGAHVGRVLLPPGDLFGDPVNVASKLGEDVAEEGEFLISVDVQAAIQSTASGGLPSHISVKKLEKRTVTVSDVEIEHFAVEGSVLMPGVGSRQAWAHELKLMHLAGVVKQKVTAKRLQFLEFADLLILNEDPSATKVTPKELHDAIESRFGREITLVSSDMSGFTRLVKKKGIIHFLRMIMIKRALVRPLIERCGGEIVFFEGDNIVASLPDPNQAMLMCHHALRLLHRYNKDVDEDSRIIVKFGVHTGTMFQHEQEIFGDHAEYGEFLAEEVGERMAIQVSEAAYQQLDKRLAPDAVSSNVTFKGQLKTRFSLSSMSDHMDNDNDRDNNNNDDDREFASAPVIVQPNPHADKSPTTTAAPPPTTAATTSTSMSEKARKQPVYRVRLSTRAISALFQRAAKHRQKHGTKKPNSGDHETQGSKSTKEKSKKDKTKKR